LPATEVRFGSPRSRPKGQPRPSRCSPPQKADLAVARGDLNLPANAESVAILRKNVVVLWAPSGQPAKGSKKKPDPKNQGD